MVADVPTFQSPAPGRIREIDGSPWGSLATDLDASTGGSPFRISRCRWTSAPSLLRLLPRLWGPILVIGTARFSQVQRADEATLFRARDMPPNPWSDEKTAALKQLVREGYSSGVIAGRLNVTRSAVVGRCHRLGLHLGANRRGLNKFTQFSLRKPHQRPLKKRKSITAKPQPQFEKAPIPPPNINDIGRVKFSELEPHHCRFGVGDPKDPDFKFCGLDRIPGRPYCSGHTARAYAGLPPKKPRTPSHNRETIRVKTHA